MSKPTVPYENATSGENARKEISKILAGFGCQQVGFMDDFENKEIILAFKYKNNPVQLKASAQGWAAMFLKAKPYNFRMRNTQKQYEQKALEQGMIAVNSVLRDWVKGKITAIETGILKFEHEFYPYMLLPSGRTIAEEGLRLPSSIN